MPFLEQKFKSKESSPADPDDTHFKVAEVASGSKSVDQNEIMDLNDESDDDSAPEQVVQDQSHDLRNYRLARDRARRTNIRPPTRYDDSEMVFYALHIAEHMEFSEPGSYTEVITGAESKLWYQAMKDEIDSLIKNKTWVLVDKAPFRKVIGCKWVFKKKLESSETGDVRFKARLVAKSFNQQEGIDFNEVFSPVVKHSSIRVLLSIVAKRNWELEQLDVKTAFFEWGPGRDNMHDAASRL